MQIVVFLDRTTNSCTVSGIVRNLPRSPWTWKHEDGLLSCVITCWLYPSTARVPDLEVCTNKIAPRLAVVQAYTQICSLPGAAGMYGLSLGVQHMNEILPAPVYALLSGLNASTVGIIALAAVQLAEKAIRDKLTRILVIAGACAGLCYNALWYFPLLMLLGGLATVIWDGGLSQKIAMMKTRLKRRKSNPEGIAEETGATDSVPLEERVEERNNAQRRNITTSSLRSGHSREAPSQATESDEQLQPSQNETTSDHAIRVRVGIAIVVAFFGK